MNISSRFGPATGEAVLAQAAAAYRDALGDRLIGAYALGSLAHGGFSPLVSDIDLGLVIADPLGRRDASVVERIAAGVRRGPSPLHGRLSVFWGTPETLRGERSGGRFPAADRVDLLDNGRLIAGSDARGALKRPAPAELVSAGGALALEQLGRRRRPRLSRANDPVAAARRPHALLAADMRTPTKLVLMPVRLLFTGATGRVASNDAAAGLYLERDAAPGAPLVASALAWRTVPPADRAPAAELLRTELLPLYSHFVDAYASLLRSVGDAPLARALERCGRALGF